MPRTDARWGARIENCRKHTCTKKKWYSSKKALCRFHWPTCTANGQSALPCIFPLAFGSDSTNQWSEDAHGCDDLPELTEQMLKLTKIKQSGRPV